MRTQVQGLEVREAIASQRVKEKVAANQTLYDQLSLRLQEIQALEQRITDERARQDLLKATIQEKDKEMERLHAQIAAFPEVTERLTRDSLNQLAELDALCQAERRERLLREAEIEALKQQIEAEKHLQSDLRREIEKMRENSSRDAVTIADKEAARLDLVHALAARDQQIAVLQEQGTSTEREHTNQLTAQLEHYRASERLLDAQLVACREQLLESRQSLAQRDEALAAATAKSQEVLIETSQSTTALVVQREQLVAEIRLRDSTIARLKEDLGTRCVLPNGHGEREADEARRLQELHEQQVGELHTTIAQLRLGALEDPRLESFAQRQHETRARSRAFTRWMRALVQRTRARVVQQGAVEAPETPHTQIAQTWWRMVIGTRSQAREIRIYCRWALLAAGLCSRASIELQREALVERFPLLAQGTTLASRGQLGDRMRLGALFLRAVSARSARQEAKAPARDAASAIPRNSARIVRRPASPARPVPARQQPSARGSESQVVLSSMQSHFAGLQAALQETVRQSNSVTRAETLLEIRRVAQGMEALRGASVSNPGPPAAPVPAAALPPAARRAVVAAECERIRQSLGRGQTQQNRAGSARAWHDRERKPTTVGNESVLISSSCQTRPTKSSAGVQCVAACDASTLTEAAADQQHADHPTTVVSTSTETSDMTPFPSERPLAPSLGTSVPAGTSIATAPIAEASSSPYWVPGANRNDNSVAPFMQPQLPVHYCGSVQQPLPQHQLPPPTAGGKRPTSVLLVPQQGCTQCS